MGLDNANYISQLNQNNPLPDDVVSQGDDHLRNVKLVLKQTFPGSAGAGYSKPITASEDELNNLVGLDKPLADFIDTTIGDSIDTVDTPAIVDDAITTPKIIDGAVTEAKLDVAELQRAGLLPTAWCVFDGSGANSAPQTILSSFNIASVEQTANNGAYDVYFTTPMTNANYVVTLGVKNRETNSVHTIIAMLKRNEDPSTTTFHIKTEAESSGDFSGIKAQRVSVLVFGGM